MVGFGKSWGCNGGIWRRSIGGMENFKNGRADNWSIPSIVEGRTVRVKRGSDGDGQLETLSSAGEDWKRCDEPLTIAHALVPVLVDGRTVWNEIERNTHGIEPDLDACWGGEGLVKLSVNGDKRCVPRRVAVAFAEEELGRICLMDESGGELIFG